VGRPASEAGGHGAAGALVAIGVRLTSEARRPARLSSAQTRGAGDFTTTHLERTGELGRAWRRRERPQAVRSLENPRAHGLAGGDEVEHLRLAQVLTRAHARGIVQTCWRWGRAPAPPIVAKPRGLFPSLGIDEAALLETFPVLLCDVCARTDRARLRAAGRPCLARVRLPSLAVWQVMGRPGAYAVGRGPPS
jgi:hypothetical protein